MRSLIHNIMIIMIPLKCYFENVHIVMLTIFITNPLFNNGNITWTMQITEIISIKVFTYLPKRGNYIEARKKTIGQNGKLMKISGSLSKDFGAHSFSCKGRENTSLIIEIVLYVFDRNLEQ